MVPSPCSWPAFCPGSVSCWTTTLRWLRTSTVTSAAWLSVSTAELEAAQLASQVFQLASLDAPLAGEQDVTVGDLVGAEDPQIEHAVDIEAVWQHLPQLPARQQRLLMMRFYGNMSQAQIGEALGISQMHVSRQLTRALAYLRERLLSPGELAGD